MIIIRCRINEEHIFDLLKWDGVSFNANPCLELETSDLQHVKEVFDNLNKIEIYYNENLVATYTQYNAYSSIEFVASEYDENRGAFFSILKIGLTQKSLIDKVDELDKIINGVVDIDSMTASEYKDYIISVYGAQGQKDIFEGTTITLEDGTTALFTYDFEDQFNLSSALQIIVLGKMLGMDIEKIPVPYHSHHRACEVYKSMDMLRIYIGLKVNSVQIQTRVNLLNNWIRSLTTKEEMMEVKYDSELPEEYQQKYETIIAETLQLVNNIVSRLYPNEQINPIDNTEESTGNNNE